ncbi:chaperonin 10-like protein [Pholiota molesta]|nr:chaperonin 10-like protein [Pholiota molesta]
MTIPTTTRQYCYSQTDVSYKNLVVKEAPVPKVKANDVLVKIHAVSLQYRDLMIAGGKYPIARPADLVPLSDSAGEIIAIGEDVQGWKVGDRVSANFAPGHVHGATNREIQATSLGGQAQGVLTEYRTFPATSIVAIPKHLSYEEASTLPCAALTAYNALNGPVPIKAGDYVLVLGTGGVSTLPLRLEHGNRDIVLDEKLKIASKLGAKHLINYKTTPNWDEEVLKITNGEGVHHVIEVGGGTLSKSVKSARIGCGQVHIIGHVATEEGDPNVVLPLILSAVSLRGIHIGSVAQFKDMNRLIEANPETTKPVHVGKVVIKVTA